MCTLALHMEDALCTLVKSDLLSFWNSNNVHPTPFLDDILEVLWDVFFHCNACVLLFLWSSPFKRLIFAQLWTDVYRQTSSNTQETTEQFFFFFRQKNVRIRKTGRRVKACHLLAKHSYYSLEQQLLMHVLCSVRVGYLHLIHP